MKVIERVSLVNIVETKNSHIPTLYGCINLQNETSYVMSW